MAVTLTITWTSGKNLIGQRKAYLLENMTVDMLNPLYPDTIQTQADVNAIIEFISADYDWSWNVANNPGCLSYNSTTTQDESGIYHTTGVWVMEDMGSLNLMLDKFPIPTDWRLYEIIGTNLVRKSDGVAVLALSPEQYIRWYWNIYAQLIGERVITEI